MRIALFRRAHFNAAHKLAVPTWSDERNLETFGKCANPNFHGHNYEIEVKVVGEVDPETGMVIDLKVLKQLLEDEVVERFDHKNLNLDCPEFENLMPTVEHICYVIYEIIVGKLDPKYDITVRLFETPRNYVEYPA